MPALLQKAGRAFLYGEKIMTTDILQDGILSTDSIDFFISYSKGDLDTVQRIVEVMENLYHAKCWFQVKDSKAEFADSIIDGIERAKVFLLFVSPHSAESFFVLNEVHHAMQWSQKHSDYLVLPVVLDQVDPQLTQPIYKTMSFYISRLNMLYYEGADAIDELIMQIFNQAGFKILDESFRASLYHYSENEAVRLKAQNEVLLEFSRGLIEQSLKPDSFVLDIGCAGGDYISMQLADLPYRGLLGIDLDPAQAAAATAKYGSEKNTFLACDALSPEFDEVLMDYLEDQDARAFDLITISAVLLHIDNPVRLLKTLRRFLSRDGYLIIQDEDDGANVVYPTSRFYDLAFRIWADSKESGDRFCARKIPSYLTEAGYRTVKLSKCGIANAGMSDAHKSALWDIYFNYHLWLAADENMFYHLSATQKLLEEYKDLYEEYKAQYDRGEAFVQLGFYLFTAQK